MVGSGGAAFAGLIFVAMSINHEIIFRNTTHKNRAINMLTGFTAIFMASSFALIGNQYLGVLGFDWLVLWLIFSLFPDIPRGFTSLLSQSLFYSRSSFREHGSL